MVVASIRTAVTDGGLEAVQVKPFSRGTCFESRRLVRHIAQFWGSSAIATDHAGASMEMSGSSASASDSARAAGAYLPSLAFVCHSELPSMDDFP